ncbi:MULTISPECIES: 3-oxoacyl-ACP reductase family protein [unclassified Nostoc]|uniref:3-oxoacyl-ACP reductase family protein n=1 Tax=unclassified Nostoc TaxID=2593658 RepID=UPI002AD1DE0D|nr:MULTISPECIES: 3-oxoacyl-ACP reductase family protein [unclassified Nostoc]MDZ8123225.1 3-oxoacyl-ACP reductase family protein [Nostoc sp. CmiVER01]MDZ8227925.1 3-oxoacyl-ACP reductase family protein [Nostoc sp. ChiVER01]
MSTKKLTDKVALVTGGSRGLGAAIAKRLADDGATVALTYTSSPQKADEVVLAIEAAGGKALALRADSANVEAVKNAVAETVKAFGRIDILVNNAGIAAFALIDEFSLDDFDRLIAVNVKGVFVATQEAVRHMGEGGRIIMIGSVNSDIMPIAGGSVYALTKGAIASFTRGLARDLGPRGITVNNIQPGPIDTDMNPADGTFADRMKSITALQRYGRSEEVADMVSYLASAEASFVTGANLKIDGGFAA